MINKIIQGDCLEVMKDIPDNSIDCVVTSPPYYGLRDYGVQGQLGLEETPEIFINKLCDLFDEIKRALKPSGTCFVNLGDSYGGTGDKGKYNDPKNPEGRNGQVVSLSKNQTKKSLMMIPERFAIEMLNRGWILRNQIIWNKPNAMPSSVKDRFTVDFEKIFFFVKSKKYFFNQQFEPHTNKDDVEYRKKLREGCKYNTKEPYKKNTPYAGKSLLRSRRGGDKNPDYINPSGRNVRTTWIINTKPYKEAHFATFPEEIPRRCLDAGCPEGGVVLDPFFGAGTTGLVAKKLGMNYIGIDLNPEYCEIARQRIGLL